MADYRLSPAAQRDLEQIFDHTVDRWGLTKAQDYTDRIEAACAELAKAPQRAPSCDYIRPGYRRYLVERHVIYFTLANYGITVVRVLHQQMEARGRV